MSNGAASSSPPGSSDAKQNTQDKVQDVAGQVQDKAREAAGKTQASLQQQIDQRAKQAGEQVTGTAHDLRSVGEELRKQGKDAPARIADRAAEQTEKVGSYLSGTNPDQMLHDVEDFGRKRPWAMLAGGLALGTVAARFLKASSRSRYRQGSASNGSQAPRQSQVQPPSPPQESAGRVQVPGPAAGTAGTTPSPPEPAGSPVARP
jgi:hypothetical protein